MCHNAPAVPVHHSELELQPTHIPAALSGPGRHSRRPSPHRPAHPSYACLYLRISRSDRWRAPLLQVRKSAKDGLIQDSRRHKRGLLPDGHERAKFGVAAPSSGNHAAALSQAARWRGIPAYIVMPANSSAAKKSAVEAYGGQITESEPNIASREAVTAEVIKRTGAHLVHPYNDARVIAGQGTAALEMLEDIPDLDVVITPASGGGLLSGTAIAAKSLRPTIRVIGGEPRNADDFYRSLASGKIEPAGTHGNHRGRVARHVVPTHVFNPSRTSRRSVAGDGRRNRAGHAAVVGTHKIGRGAFRRRGRRASALSKIGAAGKKDRNHSLGRKPRPAQTSLRPTFIASTFARSETPTKVVAAANHSAETQSSRN